MLFVLAAEQCRQINCSKRVFLKFLPNMGVRNESIEGSQMKMCLAVFCLCLTTLSAADAGITIGSAISVAGGGLGFGNAPPVLTLQGSSGNASVESGEIAWNGTVDVASGTDPTTSNSSGGIDIADSMTVTAGAISALGSDFGISFNINEGGNPKDVDLQNLTVTLYDSSGGTIDSASIAPGVLSQPGGGQGSDGLFFPVTLMSQTATTFFADANNRLGLSATIADISGGAESFRVATAVPEPSAFVMLGLLGCAIVGWRQYRSVE